MKTISHLLAGFVRFSAAAYEVEYYFKNAAGALFFLSALSAERKKKKPQRTLRL